MTIIIAPDSFKGSLSAVDVCGVIESAAKMILPDTKVLSVPMADGGEGTLQSLVSATNGSLVRVADIQDPQGRRVDGYYGLSGDKKIAIVELAIASGLHLVPTEERQAGRASTYGTGQIIRQALNQGIREFIIGLGGSATTDGGVGLLKALGFKFKDALKQDIPDGGEALYLLKEIDDTGVDESVKEAHFNIANDVTNPLVGKMGAAHVFAPQKGANPDMVKKLDYGLCRYADCIETYNGKRLHDIKGAGAAGGTAAGLIAFLNADLRSGIDLVREYAEFNQILENESVELIITGEGQLDSQTFYGKVISGICQSAKLYDIPVVALTGAVIGDSKALFEMGLTAAFGLSQGPMTLEESIANTKDLLYQKSLHIFRLWSLIK